MLTFSVQKIITSPVFELHNTHPFPGLFYWQFIINFSNSRARRYTLYYTPRGGSLREIGKTLLLL